ncbi:hypothetical protein M413DRAFT_21870 [Hebeloma cylindrosporum]|uniref:G domain-containing protein n=1 Tax=Hebeloma cylindrosporum TaxID=76867 RepID=A0A0C2Z986_HEBCY|nr:hypothetical protein M413DRAFT_21870 [Hebeloma cylindrosporum h7]
MPPPYKTSSATRAKLRDDDIVIAFIGETGSGKSQIIDTLTGPQPEGPRAGDGLHVVTKKLEACRILDHERYGSRIVLVDTPGFDDFGTGPVDENTFKLIGSWLKKASKKGILLSGIVYTHSIEQRRLNRFWMRSDDLHLFSELTGRDGAKNVVFTTTNWDLLGLRNYGGIEREEHLKKSHWFHMISHGALVDRFLNTPDSAWSIIYSIVDENYHKAPLSFPQKKVDQEALEQDQEDTPPKRTYKTELVQASKLGNDDIIIAFTGPTGSGKSQVCHSSRLELRPAYTNLDYSSKKIIDTLTGQQGQRAKRSLESVTKDLEASRILDHEKYGSRVVLVDTPGFDDSSRTDAQILELLDEWLRKTYEKRVLLSGIVYTHRITDPRMPGTPHRNLLVFSELTGRKGTKNVVLATTMWDRLHPTKENGLGDKREGALKKEYWNLMIYHGAAVDRFLNTSDSAWSIVDNIVNKHDQKAPLLFQQQRVEQEKSLPQTSAGEALEQDLARLVKNHKKTMKKSWWSLHR